MDPPLPKFCELCTSQPKNIQNNLFCPFLEKSVLYPNQALPPPVYTNISKLQAAAQRGVGGAPKDSAPATSEDSRRAETPPLVGPTHSLYDNQSGESCSPSGRRSVEFDWCVNFGAVAFKLKRSMEVVVNYFPI